MRYTEKELKEFAEPIPASEDEKCQRAIRMVRDALKGVTGTSKGDVLGAPLEGTRSYTLDVDLENSRKVKLLVQGSYANQTNIPSESDVDIAVILESSISPWSAYSMHLGVKDSEALLAFKNEVESRMKNKFREGTVRRCDKHIEVRGNSLRVDSDVVPCGRNGGMGVKIRADSGKILINYPEQHIKNGVSKNQATRCRFKKIVRIMKSIRVEMEDVGYKSAEKIGSFVIESLLWNVPDEIYNSGSNYSEIFNFVLCWLHQNPFDFFREINGIKYLKEDDEGRIELCHEFVKDLFNFIRS